MINIETVIEENFKQIEDIIDTRKSLGQYNIRKFDNDTHLSNAPSNMNDATIRDNNLRFIRFEDTISLNEGDSLNNPCIKQTDSEVTVVRVKCSDITLKRRRSKWDMHDIAIPGDGSHLAESPSLVNLVTLVGRDRPFEGEEYLVPLSSWDPYYKSDVFSRKARCCSDSKLCETASTKRNPAFTDNLSEGSKQKGERIVAVSRRTTLAGKISKFIRKYCTKPKTPGSDVSKS